MSKRNTENKIPQVKSSKLSDPDDSIDLFTDMYQIKRMRSSNDGKAKKRSKRESKTNKNKYDLYSLDNLIRDRQREIEQNEIRQKLLNEAPSLESEKETQVEDIIQTFMNEYSFSETEDVLDDTLYTGELTYNLDSYLRKYGHYVKTPSVFGNEKRALFLIRSGNIQYNKDLISKKVINYLLRLISFSNDDEVVFMAHLALINISRKKTSKLKYSLLLKSKILFDSDQNIISDIEMNGENNVDVKIPLYNFKIFFKLIETLTKEKLIELTTNEISLILKSLFVLIGDNRFSSLHLTFSNVLSSIIEYYFDLNPNKDYLSLFNIIFMDNISQYNPKLYLHCIRSMFIAGKYQKSRSIFAYLALQRILNPNGTIDELKYDNGIKLEDIKKILNMIKFTDDNNWSEMYVIWNLLDICLGYFSLEEINRNQYSWMELRKSISKLTKKIKETVNKNYNSNMIKMKDTIIMISTKILIWTNTPQEM